MMEDGMMLLSMDVLDTDTMVLRNEKAIKEAANDYHKRKAAIDNFIVELADSYDPVTAEDIIADIAKKCKIRKVLLVNEYQKLLKATGAQKNDISQYFTDKTEQDEHTRKGFWQAKHCYYFITKDGVFKASNFTIKPLIHIYSKISDNNKRIIEIINEHGRKKSVDIPSKIWVSLDAFQGIVIGEGNYLFFGSSFHFKRILGDINESFPEANELRTMGWQSEGFWAFSNGIYSENKWQPVDNLGVTEHKNVKYFSPAFSDIFKNVRQDDDEHKADRYFIYKPSPVTFKEWADTMNEVYLDKAKMAIAFLCASLFRDFIYEQYKIFPHLFLFGETQCGKSQLAWSLSNIFYDNLPPFNLNSGTQVGFFRRLARIKNAIAWYDEYTNDIDEKRFQSIKAAYDGVGHEKGKMSKDNRTDVTEVNQSILLSGQYLPTRDDNAVFNRALMIFFEKREFTKEQIMAFDKLKRWESEGLSSLIFEILSYRKLIEKNYAVTFSDVFESVKQSIVSNNKEDETRERIIRNYSIMLAVAKVLIVEGKMDFGYTYQDLYSLSLSMIREQTSQISNSEGLSTFFKMIEFMFENILIMPGKDFAIATYTEISINDKGTSKRVSFDPPGERLLFLRLTNIHPIYMENYRKQHGKTGIDLISLTHYIKQSRAYIGESRSFRFETINTSAFVLRYDNLNISLEKNIISTLDEPDTSSKYETKQIPF
ncbi:MAG: hypothetical protein WC319_10980 [Candidatus Paceibacterota bacterium]|jgi:hypothetical protein